MYKCSNRPLSLFRVSDGPLEEPRVPIFFVIYLCLFYFCFIFSVFSYFCAVFVLPQKPSFAIMCVFPAIIGLHHMTDKLVLLPHRLHFGWLPWRCLWKMEGLGGINAVPQGVSWRHQWSPLSLGKAQNVTRTEEWPTREISPWIRRRHNNNQGE